MQSNLWTMSSAGPVGKILSESGNESDSEADGLM